MANSFTLLDDLKADHCSKTEVHILRFWEAKNVKKGGHWPTLIGADFLLVDEKEPSQYFPTRSNNNFRLSDAPVSIRFNDGTSWRDVNVCVSLFDGLALAFHRKSALSQNASGTHLYLDTETAARKENYEKEMARNLMSNDDVSVEKPVASNGSVGADNTLAEVASVVGAEGGEITTAKPSAILIYCFWRISSLCIYHPHT
ncbi:hypothetical protein Bca4012_025845 [Brassica carinata]